MKPRRTHLIVAIVVLIPALALSACGGSSEGGTGPTRISLTLDAAPNPNHAGIYTARKLGYFERAGIEVAIRTPPNPAAAIERVAAGRTDLAIAYEPEVVLARARGRDLIAVGSLVDNTLTSLTWLGKSGVNGVADLRGKTIATAGIPYQDAYLKTILAGVGLTPSEVRKIDVGDGLLPALVSGRADAILGGFRNIEGMNLRLRDADPVVNPVSWNGVPEYDELVFVAGKEALDENPEAIRRFLAAVVRGTREAQLRPRAVATTMLEANPSLEPAAARAQIDDTLSLLSRDARMDPAGWSRFIAWMHENELIEEPIPASDLLTNEYLPGEIPD